MNQTQIQYLMNLPYTDPGNAERLHVMIGSDWKFVPQINRWVHWNGKRWQEETNAVLRNVAVASYRACPRRWTRRNKNVALTFWTGCENRNPCTISKTP